MKRLLFLLSVLFLLISSTYLNAQSIKGKVIDVETNKTVDDAVITTLKDQKSILSDADGSFEIKIAGEDETYQLLHCYRIGYYDTIVKFQKIDKQLLLKLRPKVYELGEVVINATHNGEKYQIGSYDVAVGGNYFLNKNASTGIYVKKKKEHKNSVLTSISFHIAEAGKLGGQISLRIVSPKKRMSPNKSESINEMQDILQQTILLPVSKRGWNTVDLKEYNIQLPDVAYFVIFTPILKSNQTIEDRVLLSMHERAYKKTPFYAAYYLHKENKLTYLYVKPTKFDYMPAVVLHCEKF